MVNPSSTPRQIPRNSDRALRQGHPGVVTRRATPNLASHRLLAYTPCHLSNPLVLILACTCRVGRQSTGCAKG